MERTDSDRCKSILRIFNQLVAIRSRGDEARWKAMSYADHRTPTDTRSSDCPVEKLNLYDCTGVMAIRTLVESLGGSVMSPNQDWFSLRISPRSYRTELPPSFGVEYTTYAKKTIANELNHSNFYDQQSLAFYDSITCGYSCTLFQNDDENDRIYLQTFEPWNCWFDTDIKGNYNIFFYRYFLDGDKLIERFGSELSEKVYKEAATSGKTQSFELLYCIMERPYFRDERGRKLRFSQRISKRMKYAAFHILKYDNTILGESGYTEMPVVIHVWENDGDSPYGKGLVMKYQSELSKLRRTAYEYGHCIAKLNHGPWLVPQNMMNSFSDDPEQRIPYNSNDLIPRPLQEKIDVKSAGEQLALQQTYITKLFYNDIFSYLLNQDKVFTATQVNAVKAEGMAKIYPIYARLQKEKIDPSLLMVYKLMVRNGRLDRPDEYLSVGNKKDGNKLEFILDSAMSQMMQRYQAQTSNSVLFDLYIQLTGLNKGNVADKYMNLGNLILAYMEQTGADSALYRTPEERAQMEEEERRMLAEARQQQMDLTQSEINRNNAGAANLNNRAGANGGFQ